MQALALSALLTLGLGHETGLILTQEEQRLFKLPESEIMMMGLHVRAGGTIPKELNWGPKINPVKDQGACGSCWAFAAADALAARHLVKNGELIDISEKHMTDCTYPVHDGCKGGNSNVAWANVGRKGAAAQDKYFPYNQKSEDCPSQDDFVNKGFERKAFVGASIGAPLTHKYWGGPAIELKEELAKYGPCAMYLGVDDEFGKTGTGVWKCTTETNHAVTVVGYGTKDGEDYWMIKNSWGPEWGDKGYIRVSIEGCPLGDPKGVAVMCPEVRKLPYVPPEEPEDELWEETPSAHCGTDPKTRVIASLAECKALCLSTPGCMSINAGSFNGEDHICLMCKTDKLTVDKKHPWTTNYKYTGPVAEMIALGGCGEIATNLGKDFLHPSMCLAAAQKEEKCGDTIMWSEEYNEHWGCMCCTKDGRGETVDVKEPNKYWKRYAEQPETEEEPDCEEWGCTCQGLSDKYLVNYYVSWGNATPEAQKWYNLKQCTTKPVCAPWGCTCQGLSDKFGTSHGVTWGSATKEAHDWWMANKCTTKAGRKEESGCDEGYVYKAGLVPWVGGLNKDGGLATVSDCDDCAGLCNDNADCMSYECSPTELKCKLNTLSNPTTKKYKDYMFCSKVCKDNDERCEKAAKDGYCQNDPIMRDDCKKSCGVCRVPDEKEVCRDNHEMCEEWAAKKECDNNPGYMHAHCKKSCGECDDEDVCKDKNENCAGWAKAGECKKNPWYMLPNCPASCGTCDDEPLKTAVGYCKPNTAESRIGGLKHVKGFERDIDCYLARCAFDAKCVASSLGFDGECIAYSECSGMEPNPGYKTTFKPKPKPTGPVCNRPKTGCKGEGDIYQQLDCDRDGVKDHVCTNIKGPIRQWVALSSSGDCSKWVFDKGGMCRPPADTLQLGYCKPNTPESRIGGFKRFGPYNSNEKCFADRCAKDPKCVASTLGKDGECIAYSKCSEITVHPNFKTMVKPAPRRLSDIMEAKALEMEEMDASAAPVNELMPPAPAL